VQAAKSPFFFKQWGGVRPSLVDAFLGGMESITTRSEVSEHRGNGFLNRKAKRVTDPYSGREQTKPRFHPKRYLQALAFKS